MPTTRFDSQPNKREINVSHRSDIREIRPASTSSPRFDVVRERRRDFQAPPKNVTRGSLSQFDDMNDLPDSISRNTIPPVENNASKGQQRVLVITSAYPKDATDDAVSWMRETHRQMTERGHEVTVLAPSCKGARSHTLDGIEVRRFRYAPSAIECLTNDGGTGDKIRNRYMQLLTIPYIIFGCIAAAWLVSTRKFDVVHVHWTFPNGFLGQVARFFSGAPLVIMSHSAELSRARRNHWTCRFLKQSLRAADLLISDTSDTARMVTKLSQRKCHILPCGTKIKAANVEQPKNKVLQVLFSGELTECKGLEYLLQAVPQILAKHPAQFIIIGDGDQRSKLEKMHQDLMLGDSVKFLGRVSDEQLGYEYANCDIWVNPAIVDRQGAVEEFPAGAIEAYNYFKPVVVGDVGGNPDGVIDGVTGRLVPEKDPKALADAICDLLADPAARQRMGRNGFYFAQQAFSVNRVVTDLESLYRTVARDPQRKAGVIEARKTTEVVKPRCVCQTRHDAPAYESYISDALVRLS